jgi:hypothetical protein
MGSVSKQHALGARKPVSKQQLAWPGLAPQAEGHTRRRRSSNRQPHLFQRTSNAWVQDQVLEERGGGALLQDDHATEQAQRARKQARKQST